VSHNLENALANLLVSEFANNYSQLLKRQTRAPAPYYVKRAEEYIREHLCAPLTLAEIAQAADISVRSLQCGFRQFRDTTPTAYLREQRLECARGMLQRAAQENISITDVALACGFHHLSKFAQHYRHRFGEAPMATKRRL
jgi:transcriptional regulator GlxA family with amidase domain